jgi:hypothetical protein
LDRTGADGYAGEHIGRSARRAVELPHYHTSRKHPPMRTVDLSRIRDLRGNELPCYLRYPRKAQPQPAYVELAQNGEVRASATAKMGDAATVSNPPRRWKIDPALRGE